MSGPFDSETEMFLRRFWKLLLIASVPLVLLAMAAAVLIGLAIRSGSFAMPDVIFVYRGAALIFVTLVSISCVMMQVGSVRTGLSIPIVRTAVPLIAFGLGLLFTGVDAGDQYFSTSAQVIPVLLLALAIEGRAFALDRIPGNHWLGREAVKASVLMTMFALAGGEALALAATTQEAPSPLLTGIVAGALASGFTSVMMYSMLGRFSDPGSAPAPPAEDGGSADMDAHLSSPQPPKAREGGPSS